MDNIQLECKRCGTWYGSPWAENGGCPACQGVIGYPYKFMETEEYQHERAEKHRKQQQESWNANIGGITPQRMTQEEFDFIIKDLCVTEWRDGQAYEMVERLVCHILATDKTTVKKLTLDD